MVFSTQARWNEVFDNFFFFLFIYLLEYLQSILVENFQ